MYHCCLVPLYYACARTLCVHRCTSDVHRAPSGRTPGGLGESIARDKGIAPCEIWGWFLACFRARECGEEWWAARGVLPQSPRGWVVDLVRDVGRRDLLRQPGRARGAGSYIIEPGYLRGEVQKSARAACPFRVFAGVRLACDRRAGGRGPAPGLLVRAEAGVGDAGASSGLAF